MVTNANLPTANPGTLPPENETVRLLKSIDARLEKLEACTVSVSWSGRAIKTTHKHDGNESA
jgi:hypothetical protein